MKRFDHSYDKVPKKPMKRDRIVGKPSDLVNRDKSSVAYSADMGSRTRRSRWFKELPRPGRFDDGVPSVLTSPSEP